MAATGATTKAVVSAIPRRSWVAIVFLGMVGQLAWNVENTWFNTFVFDSVTPDPAPIAWMVAVSAVVATATAFIAGAWSDRIGRRKPFLLWGYILWGLATAAFPTAIFFQITGLVVLMVILFDAVMGVFGAAANDAAYNAWIVDITDESNRARVLSVLAILPALLTAVTAVIGGMVIDTWGYFPFFYGVGGIVLLAGLLVKPLVRESPALQPSGIPVRAQLRATFAWQTVTENRVLFLVLLGSMLAATANQISLPYLFIYLENFIGISKSQIGVVTLVLTAVSGLAAILLGSVLDRWDRRWAALLAGLLVPAGIVVFAQLRTVPQFYALGAFYLLPGLLFGIVAGAWAMDLYPADSRGKFQGVRMIFQVMLPMVIGPPIGALVISRTGIPTISNGQAGFVPTPAIFLATALFALLALIPIFLTPRHADPFGGA